MCPLNKSVLLLLFAISLPSSAAESAIPPSAAESLTKCNASPSTADQRDCLPIVLKQSSTELKTAERQARSAMVALEKTSAENRRLHPVRAFDLASTAFSAFRQAECNRVLTAYGSGNGGGLAAWTCAIKMNLARIEQLSHE